MCVAIVWKLDYDVMNFDINLVFLIKPFFLHDQKIKRNESRAKKRTERKRTKRVFKVK